MIQHRGTALLRVLCAALGFLILLTAAAPCLAATKAENEAITVRVGYFAFEGYHEQDADGLRSGYGYELLQRLAGYANFRYTYVGYDKSWNDMQDMLANGEIDLLTSAQKTPEREARFDFSREDIGMSSAILTVKAGDIRFMNTGYSNWNGIRVGMLTGNSRNESLDKYAAEKGFAYVPVYFDSTDAMVAALRSDSAARTIDAALTSNLREIRDEWILAEFDASPFYIMVRKGNRELLDRIDAAVEALDTCEPNVRTTLMTKYYTPTSSDEIAFSPEERAFLQEVRGRTFTALLNPDRAPYSWVEDGVWKGIFVDVAAEMCARSGLSVAFLNVADREAYWAAVEQGRADIRFDAVMDYNQAEKDGCWLTQPYDTVPVARVHRKNVAEYRTAAAPANRDITESYAQAMESQGLSVAYYPSIADTVQAVMDGERDVALLVMDAASLAVRNDITNKLVADEVFGDERAYAVAVNQDESPLLYSILSKVADSVTQREVETIRQRYATYLTKPFSLIGYFYDYPLHVMIGAAGVLFVIALIGSLVFLSRRRKTEQKRLEKEQRQNGALKDALDAAEKAGAAKSQFLSRVSHEMRTPLNAIIGFIELARGAGKEETENYLASSDLAAKQLLNVINDVLDMSSIEAGKLKIASAPFDFKRMLSSLTNIYGTQCRQKGLDFETRLDTPTEDWLEGDELRVNQILTNLLGNAVKFTAKGHIWLTVSQTSVKGDKLFLRFQVSDTGCGMSEEMMERLFKPFEQENASTAQRYGGSGLGLSIVKNLVGMMDGSVRVESEQGQGTTFIVDLPFKRSGIVGEAQLPGKLGDLRILAVDDEQGERAYISAVLRRMGVRYTCVNGGGEALDELAKAERERDGYNVCLVDWRMPDMNGIDATRQIRRKYGNDVIVIIVSAYDYQQMGESAREAGANLFISKPVFQSSLFDLLMTLTGGKIAAAQEEPTHWDFAGKRVLLAEDNVLNQIVASGYLAKVNVAVELAENGQIAVEMFAASAPGYYDAILMDIQMPVMDGFAATKAIRGLDRPDARTIQIIAQTADAFTDDVAKTLSAGMNAHLSKPIMPEQLAKSLSDAFAREAKGA